MDKEGEKYQTSKRKQGASKNWEQQICHNTIALNSNSATELQRESHKLSARLPLSLKTLKWVMTSTKTPSMTCNHEMFEDFILDFPPMTNKKGYTGTTWINKRWENTSLVHLYCAWHPTFPTIHS